MFKDKTIKGNVKVSINVKYRYKEKIWRQGFKDGENILTFIDKSSTCSDRSHVNGYTVDNVEFTGRVGQIYKEDWNSDHAAYHESLHLAGLPDMYYERYPGDAKSMEGFENDIMCSRQSSIGYDHYDSYFRHAKEVYSKPGSEKQFLKGFISRKVIDRRVASEEQKRGE